MYAWLVSCSDAPVVGQTMASHVTGSAGICKNVAGAGDENRTRTISLGSAAVTAARGAGQASLAVLSDPG